MDINYNTNKLVILDYPSQAGGKFISLCLALDKNFLHQDKKLAEAKINKKMDNDYSFKISKTVLNKTKNIDNHFELGCEELAGFNSATTLEQQADLANDLWKTLTNQVDYYFCMVDHKGSSWNHYPNAKHIIFKNYEWLLDQRLQGKSVAWEQFEKDLKAENIVYFDQLSIKDTTAFKEELGKLFSFFNFNDPNWDHLEELRNSWMATFMIGYPKLL